MISVGRRFHRSISLAHDWGDPQALAGYVVSPLVRECAERLVEDLAQTGGPRAWSITGPYGTGKSAFALFLATLLAEQGRGKGSAREALQAAAPATPTRPGRWLPVLVTGERGPLLPAVLRAMKMAAAPLLGRRGRLPGVMEELNAAIRAVDDGGCPSGSDVLWLSEQLALWVKQKGWDGVLFVFDELGKFLEFAAREPGESDVFYLQQLAEKAARAQTAQIAILTVLHQSFALYAEDLSTKEQAEWQKVQGRFDEIPFLEPVDHLVQLTARAIESQEGDVPATLIAEHAQLVDRLLALRDTPTPQDLQTALRATLPLHPGVALILGPVFRGALSQNQRSLFAFLVSRENGGFERFLRETEGRPELLYGPSRLFDYIAGVFSTRVRSRRHERLWSVAEQALLAQTGEGAESRVSLLQSLALLERFGADAGLRANLATLAALSGLDEATAAAELDQLGAAVVYRRHSDSYHLWDGSDIDLGKVLDDARRNVETAGDIATTLARHLSLRPIVAGRHVHEKGTLRWLEPRIVDDTVFESPIEPATPGNGVILYVLPRSERHANELRARLEDSKSRAELLPHPASVVVMPHHAERVREQAVGMLALDTALNTSRALKLDPVARRELSVQLGEATNRVTSTLARTFGWATGDTRAATAEWFTTELGRIQAPARLSRLASELLDAAFRDAPAVHNELLNRDNLSSAAARARRNLIERMIDHPRSERLGISGSPPELSMYLSILQEGQLHQPDGPDSPWLTPRGMFAPVWEALIRFLEERDEPTTVEELYAYLQAPPFGLRLGVVPVLFAAFLLSESHRVSLFEEGSLIPSLDTATAERLLRRPKTFKVRAYPNTTERQELLVRTYQQLRPNGHREPTVLRVVKALLSRYSRLPAYASATSEVSERARKARTVLATARDPLALLFHDLPRALDVDLDASDAADVFPNRVAGVMNELAAAYSSLLERLHSAILSAVGAKSMAEVVSRAANMTAKGLTTDVAAFCLRAGQALPKDDWTVAIATFPLDRQPDRWRDGDEEYFGLRIVEIARTFRSFERLQGAGGGGLPRVSIAVLDSDGNEQAAMAFLRSEERAVVAQLAATIRSEAMRSGASRDAMLAAMAEVMRSELGAEDV